MSMLTPLQQQDLRNNNNNQNHNNLKTYKMLKMGGGNGAANYGLVAAEPHVNTSLQVDGNKLLRTAYFKKQATTVGDKGASTANLAKNNTEEKRKGDGDGT